MTYFIFFFFIILFKKVEDINDFNEFIKKMIINVIYSSYNKSNICEKSIYSSFQEETPLNYLLNSSSLECNDITSYFSCFEGKKTNYYIITFKPINSTEERINGTYDTNYNLYGICIFNNSLNCTDSDIKNFIIKIAEKTEISNNKKFKIFNMNNASKIKIKKVHILLSIFFGILSISIFIFSILPTIPQILFRCCFLKQRKIKSNGMDIIVKNVDKLSLYNFCKCFNLEENTDYFICSHSSNKSYSSYGITNDEGLGYIKGIFGISIYMTLFGIFYIQLLSEPYKNYDRKTYVNMFYNPFKCFINISSRYGPRVLFSCSGYIFMFKLSCFLEEQNTEIIMDGSSSCSPDRTRSNNNNKISKSNMTDDDDDSGVSNTNDFNQNIRKDSIQFDIEEDYELQEEKYRKDNIVKKGSTISNSDKTMPSNSNQMFKSKKKEPEEITFYSLYIFYRTQLYKLLLIILTIFFMKYVLFIIFEFLEIPSPSLISFRNNLIDGITYSEIFGRIFQYLNFKILVSKDETSNYIDQSEKKNMCVVFLFWPIICELFFFIFTVPIVFMIYKFKKDPLYILSFLSIFIILLRIILYAISSGDEKMYATLFYYIGDYYGLFSINPIVNYSSFLIGCIFGYFYYLSQRMQDDKDYLGHSIKIVNFMRCQNKNLFYIINSIITFILFILAFFEQLYCYIYHWVKGDFSLKNYLANSFINYFYLTDNDLFLCFFHYLMISLFCKNEKFLIKYLSKDMWEISVKIYFSFLLFVNFIIVFIMQKTQTKINIQLFSILYYGILSWCILFVVTYFFSVLFEIPFKRISHQLFKTDEKLMSEKKEKYKLI